MDWSPQQERALLEGGQWLRAPLDKSRQIYSIHGYAGVGKTTIAKELAAQSDGLVLFAAYTGKAAYVMRSKGCTDCTTIHSLIYKPAGESKSDELRRIEQQLALLWSEPTESPEDKQERLEKEAFLTKQRDELLIRDKPKPMFSLNHESDLLEADALIVDECSMVDQQMGEDLLSFGKKILVLGDPMQLPPVGSGGYFTDRKPDHLLTEIHRHAKESGILRLATDIRTTGTFDRTPGHYGADCVVAYKSKLEDLTERVLRADQILVGRNDTRHVHNKRYRELTNRGSTLMPMAGDKVVCLRNNHKEGLLNGSLWRVHEAVVDEDIMVAEMTISSEEDGGVGLTASAWTHHFVGQENQLKLKKWNRRDKNEFDYGYALTVHKAQGSQWDDVVLWNESGTFRHDAKRWLYTGVTRAAKTLTVVL